jgi:hypothetical protein
MTYFCGTDYSVPCGSVAPSFIQMLASCLIRYTCSANTDQVRLNLIPQWGYCDNITSYWTCTNNGDVGDTGAERALVENAFALDECGNLGLKVFVNYGTQ